MSHKTFLSGSLLLTFALSVHAFSQQGEETRPAKADPQRIHELIEQLGDTQFAKRTKATAELEAIGPAALAPLRQAANSPDVEVSQRAKALIERIEATGLATAMLAPKRVRLNVADASIEEVIAELAKASGYPIQLAGDKPANRKITLDSGDVTFWEALEHLCRKAGLTERLPTSANPAQATPPQEGGPVVVKIPIRAKNAPAVGPVPPMAPAAARAASPIVLVEGKPRELLTVLAGAVRIRVVPPAEGAAPPKAGETAIWLDVTAEPRLQDFGVIGSPRIDKAIDDQGQSLVAALPAAPPEPPKGNGGNVVINGNAIMIVNGKVIGPGGMPLGPIPKQRQVAVRLKVGEKAAKSLQELSGSLAVQALKEAEPLVTVDAILKAAGQTVKGKESSSIQVQSVEKLDDGSFKLQMVLQNPPDPNFNNPLGNVVFGGGNIVINGVRFGGNRAGPPNYPKLVDAQGKDYPPASVTKQRTDFNTGKIEADVIYRPVGEPVQLVLYGQRTATFFVPFTLKNVPLP